RAASRSASRSCLKHRSRELCKPRRDLITYVSKTSGGRSAACAGQAAVNVDKLAQVEAPRASGWLSVGICVFLAVAVWVVFGQTVHHGFVNYDDDVYVYENPAIYGGLSWGGVGWAFTHTLCCNWHPLTALSHMLDCQVYGVKAGGHHLTNVLLHGVAVVLLFMMLHNLTGALWRSALVAVVFAIHPLRVESVAWVAERKDVLSGMFFMLTVWAYTQ